MSIIGDFLILDSGQSKNSLIWNVMGKGKGQCTVMGALFSSCCALRTARCAWCCRHMLRAFLVLSCDVLWYVGFVFSLLLFCVVLFFSCGLLYVSCLLLYSLMLCDSMRCNWARCLSPPGFLFVVLPIPIDREIERAIAS